MATARATKKFKRGDWVHFDAKHDNDIADFKVEEVEEESCHKRMWLIPCGAGYRGTQECWVAGYDASYCRLLTQEEITLLHY